MTFGLAALYPRVGGLFPGWLLRLFPGWLLRVGTSRAPNWQQQRTRFWGKSCVKMSSVNLRQSSRVGAKIVELLHNNAPAHQRDDGIKQLITAWVAIAGADAARPSRTFIPNIIIDLSTALLLRCLVSRSAGFSPPQHFFTIRSPLLTLSCTQR